MEITKDWKETHRVLSGQYTNTIISRYLEWKSRRVGSLPTLLINETVQSVDPQPKEVLSEAEILRQEFRVERDRLIKEKFMLQEEIGSWKCKAERDKATIQKMANRRDATIDDLHTKNERLRDELKYGPRSAKKKAKMLVESQKEIEKLQHELEQWKWYVQEKEAEHASATEKLVSEMAELEIKLKEEEKRGFDSRRETRSLQQIIQELEQILSQEIRDVAALKVHYEHQVHHRNQLLDQVWKENEDWRIESGDRKRYVEYLGKKLYKVANKAQEMLEETKALQRNTIPTRKNGQRLSFFLDEVRDHYNQVVCFYSFHSKILS